MHIAIAGNIGSGKTTLTNLLCKHYGWKPHFEAVDNNPYLDDYYKDMKRWSFNLEVFFLKHRFKDVLEIAKSKETIVQDRSIYEGVHVFTEANYAMGNLDERDFTTYMELFKQMTNMVKYPDLMVYLRSSVPHLVKNIQKRGRDYEQSIQIEYLRQINQRYEEFIYEKYKGKVLVIEVDNIDFEHNTADFAAIIDKIDRLLFGLF
ncbi:MAG: deoxynucleoside kinase [Bacteroidaceae bacterium]|nr:deoxynucleoside kinase [Bacteroidaceae bacterium]